MKKRVTAKSFLITLCNALNKPEKGKTLFSQFEKTLKTLFINSEGFYLDVLAPEPPTVILQQMFFEFVHNMQSLYDWDKCACVLHSKRGSASLDDIVHSPWTRVCEISSLENVPDGQKIPFDQYKDYAATIIKGFRTSMGECHTLAKEILIFLYIHENELNMNESDRNTLKSLILSTIRTMACCREIFEKYSLL